MQPPDVMFLDVVIAAAGMILIGLALPAQVGVLVWFGVVLIVGIGTWWVVSRAKRHHSQY